MPSRSRAPRNSVDYELGELRSGLTTLADEFKEERIAASDHRRDLRQVIGSMSEAIRVLTFDIAEIKPLAVDYREQRAENRGAMNVKKWILATTASIAVPVGAALNEVWKYLTHIK